MFTQVIAPPVGSFIMERYGAQASVAAAMIPRFLGIGLLPFVAENKKADVLDYVEETTEVEHDVAESNSWQSRLRTRLQGLSAYLRLEVFPILTQPPLLFGMFAMSTISFALPFMNILMQYMHLRFDWTYSDVCLSRMPAILCMLIVEFLLGCICPVIPRHGQDHHVDRDTTFHLRILDEALR